MNVPVERSKWIKRFSIAMLKAMKSLYFLLINAYFVKYAKGRVICLVQIRLGDEHIDLFTLIHFDKEFCNDIVLQIITFLISVNQYRYIEQNTSNEVNALTDWYM
jgi:hypothetical protein